MHIPLVNFWLVNPWIPSKNVALGAWMIWNHRNKVVFDGRTPSISFLLQAAEDEQETWRLAGAKGLSFLASQTT
jgi:hypothetical protein